MTDAVTEIFMSVCLRRLRGQYVCPCASFPSDTLQRLRLPISIMVVMETLFGVTDAFVAIRIRQTTRDADGFGGSAGE